MAAAMKDMKAPGERPLTEARKRLTRITGMSGAGSAAPPRAANHGLYDCMVARRGHMPWHWQGHQGNPEFVILKPDQARPAYITLASCRPLRI